MKKATRIAFSVLAFLFFVSAMGVFPLSAKNRMEKQAAQQTQTASGKIASVDQTSFSIQMTAAPSDQTPPPNQTPPPQSQVTTGTRGEKTMTFQIDKNTSVDGQLQVGANADVTYRQDGSVNVAISVHVS